MKKIILIGLLFLVITSFAAHKFYIAIFQINYATEKKTLQITSRIFIDDLNKVLEKKFHTKTNIGDKNETAEDIELMNKYVLKNLLIKVNGKQMPLIFLSKEIENNIIVCYYKIKNISKINTLEAESTVLMDGFPEQQNIIQSTIYNKKQSLLLTLENQSGMLK